MDIFNLEIAQMLREHPVLYEKNSYKCRYINLLEYFVRKFSPDDAWANATLQLYKNALLENLKDYTYEGFQLLNHSRTVVATKFKPFKFFSYRYCVLFDCIYINAINDKEKGENIYAELSSIYHKRYQNKIRQVFDTLYKSDISFEGLDQIGYLADCWQKNRVFLAKKPIKIIVTSTISAGKSTLLNALIGKKINRTQNDVCTAKVHYIKNKAYEDGYCYKQDYTLELDASLNILMDDNTLNANSEIIVGAYFRTIGQEAKRIWLIDTPGVNSSQDKVHKDITERYIRETQVDMLVYLLNGENIGSEDEHKHLQFVLENYKGNIVFVVNKLDKFRKNEDSVADTLTTVTSDLNEMGFASPLVVPISAMAAYLSKMSVFGEILEEEDQDEFERMVRKLKKNEYQFNTYYPERVQSDIELGGSTEAHRLLLHSGILQLENIIYRMRG